jgi:hypothetical protein
VFLGLLVVVKKGKKSGGTLSEGIASSVLVLLGRSAERRAAA